jgi:tryptophan synthase beta chain
VVKQDKYHKDLLTLSTDKAIEYTKTLKNAVYIFGSVYGYFVIPQSIIGVEAKQQLLNLDKYPDIVVGSCGGANLLGTASEFMADNIEGTLTCEIYAAESESCLILSKEKMGYSSIDNLNYYPLIHTYSLPGLAQSDYYIGGIGSIIVAPAVAHFHKNG